MSLSIENAMPKYIIYVYVISTNIVLSVGGAGTFTLGYYMCVDILSSWYWLYPALLDFTEIGNTHRNYMYVCIELAL